MLLSVIAVVFFIATSAHAVVLESGIPGVGEGGRQGAKLPGLATYINYLYIFVLSFVGIAGFISLVIWGTTWVASAVVDKKARALEGIKNTLIGIGIALTAFIMLRTINPDLTVIKMPKVVKIEGLSSGFDCSKYSAQTCPSLSCHVTSSGCKKLTGACLTDRSAPVMSWLGVMKNTASDLCYDNCNIYAETEESCKEAGPTSAFLVGKMCGELWVQATVWTGNCTLNTYNANAFK